ncbi:MAG: RNA 2',3'-cyclic phosphodiesterase [Alphaproteobacteria bacterium]
MTRLFVALALPVPVQDRLQAVQTAMPGARWVSRENFHLTLAFLGDVPPARLDDLDEALSDARGGLFNLALCGLDLFSRGGLPHTLWVGAERTPPLLDLQRSIERSLARSGFTFEKRKFRPHVTLAYLRDAPLDRVAAYIAGHSPLRLPPFRVDGFRLYSSWPGDGGRDYQVEADYHF